MRQNKLAENLKNSELERKTLSSLLKHSDKHKTLPTRTTKSVASGPTFKTVPWQRTPRNTPCAQP